MQKKLCIHVSDDYVISSERSADSYFCDALADFMAKS